MEDIERFLNKSEDWMIRPKSASPRLKWDTGRTSV